VRSGIGTLNALSEVAAVARNVARYPVGPQTLTAEDALGGTGLETITDETTLAEREATLRRAQEATTQLDPIGRAVAREMLIARGFSARMVDAALRSNESSAHAAQGAPPLFNEPEPWPEPINGGRLLDELVRAIRAHVIVPSHADVALALWILHTHVLDAARTSPRLALVSPEKRCGKSTVLKLLEILVRRALPATNVTAAVVFRTIEAHHPTLLIDEADTFLRDREELRGVLNAGHDRHGAKVLRCVGDESEPRAFDVWAPVAFACIGTQHDTLMDRSIVVLMRRRMPGEEVKPLRRPQRDALSALKRKCVRWAQDTVEQLRDSEPPIPPELNDRAADNWDAHPPWGERRGGAGARGTQRAGRDATLRSRDRR
jgi:hypothetical protein